MKYEVIMNINDQNHMVITIIINAIWKRVFSYFLYSLALLLAS